MKVGTKSVIFGVHCFLIHPWFVAMAWWRLYGFPWDPRLWVAFFVHDLGYWGKPNMDGPEGEMHPALGGRIMHFLFDRRRKSCKLCNGEGYNWEFTGDECFDAVECENCNKWGNFTVFHSRYYAKKYHYPVSKLCAADKLAFCFEPYWFYMLRANASGEIWEYLNVPYFRDVVVPQYPVELSKKIWFKTVRNHFLRWVAGNYKNL